MPLCYCTPKNPSDVGGKYFKRGRDGMEGDCAASADLGSSSESATTRFRLTNATVAISESHYDVIVDDWKIQAPHLFVGPDARSRGTCVAFSARNREPRACVWLFARTTRPPRTVREDESHSCVTVTRKKRPR